MADNLGQVYEAVVVLSGAVEGVAAGPAARFAVTIIRAGESSNGLRYPPGVLREAVALFEGAAAFCDHPGPLDQGRAGGRSLRDLVGVYEGVRWDAAEGALRGTLRLYPGAAWLATLIREAVADREAGRPAPNLGVSADMLVMKRLVMQGSGGKGQGSAWQVMKIVRAVSADVVFQPSAGGRFERILEGAADGDPIQEEELVVCTRCNQETCRCGASEQPPASVASVASGDRVVGAAGSSSGRALASGASHTTSVAGSRLAGPGGAAPESRDQAMVQDGAPLAPLAGEPLAGLALTRELEAARSIRLELCRTLLDQRLAVMGLPAPAMEYVRARFHDRVFEAAELDGEIAGVRAMLGGIVAPGVVRGMGPAAARPRVAGGMGPLERVQHAMDRMFGLQLPDALSDIPRFAGIREAYITVTGDAGFSGRYDWERSVLGEVREANEVTTSVMSLLLANSMTKRLVKDYQAQPKWWLPIAVRVALSDMKQQDRVLLNDFAALSTVQENGAYTNLAWDDAREQYTPAKKGNLVYVTLESIINDDLRGIARIPSKLAAAGAVTINEFVSGLFTANSGDGAQMADTYYVFDASNHQSNRATSALSSTTLKTAMVTLAKMVNAASKRIGVIGRHLLVPPDLMYTAQVIAGSPSEPGTANNDINPLQGKVNVVPVPNWTDTNNWYLLADPAQVECIELGFLNGREEPELLVQDSPTAGSVFTNDAISFKVRWIFGLMWAQ